MRQDPWILKSQEGSRAAQEGRRRLGVYGLLQEHRRGEGGCRVPEGEVLSRGQGRGGGVMCEHPPEDVHTLTQSSLFGDEVIQYCARCGEDLENLNSDDLSLKKSPPLSPGEYPPFKNSR